MLNSVQFYFNVLFSTDDYDGNTTEIYCWNEIRMIMHWLASNYKTGVKRILKETASILKFNTKFQNI